MLNGNLDPMLFEGNLDPEPFDDSLSRELFDDNLNMELFENNLTPDFSGEFWLMDAIGGDNSDGLREFSSLAITSSEDPDKSSTSPQNSLVGLQDFSTPPEDNAVGSQASTSASTNSPDGLQQFSDTSLQSDKPIDVRLWEAFNSDARWLPTPPAPSPVLAPAPGQQPAPATTGLHKRFSCTECDRKFTKRYDLNRHIKTVHRGEKPFKCSLCQQSYAQDSNLKQHINAHHNRIPFPCPFEGCDAAYINKSQLSKHKRDVHKR